MCKHDELQTAAITFIERHSPSTEREHEAGDWGIAFYDPIAFCRSLRGRLAGYWRRVERRITEA